MSEEIVITYKTETLSKEDLTEREKAIYNAGLKDGCSLKKAQLPIIVLCISLCIFIVYRFILAVTQ